MGGLYKLNLFLDLYRVAYRSLVVDVYNILIILLNP